MTSKKAAAMAHISKPTGLIINACQDLIDDDAYNDFWLFSGLIGWSAEEGSRNTYFKRELQHFKDAGLPHDLVQQLDSGVNGNLAARIESTADSLHVKRNKGKGQDLTISTPDGQSVATAEVKLIHDTTQDKYYANNLCRDIQKLRELPAGQIPCERSAIVFFLTLPELTYPAGTWYGQPSPERLPNRTTVAAQFSKAHQCLGLPPSWPTNESPHVRSITKPSQSSLQVYNQMNADHWKSDEHWQFDLATHLKGAEVGVAIWKVG